MQAAHDLHNPNEATTQRAVDWQGVGWYLLLAFAISWAFFFLKFAGVPFLLPASLGLASLFTWGNPYIAAPVGLFAIVPWFAFAIWLIATGRVRNNVTFSHPSA